MTGSNSSSGGAPTSATFTSFSDQLPARETALFPSLRIPLKVPINYCSTSCGAEPEPVTVTSAVSQR